MPQHCYMLYIADRAISAAPIYRPGQRPRGGNPTGGGGPGGQGGPGTGGGRGFQAYPDREPPPNYVCYRCGEKGVPYMPTLDDAFSNGTFRSFHQPLSNQRRSGV